MYLFCVDFSKNNFLAEQIDVKSLYGLPILDKFLIEHQLINFADFLIEKAFLINCFNEIDFNLFPIHSVEEKNLFKELSLSDNHSRFIAFRNDIYFESDSLSKIIEESEDLACIKDKDGRVLCIIGAIAKLKILLNKNIELSEIFKNAEKFVTFTKSVDDGYVMNLNSIKSYKNLIFDILNSKTIYKPPYIAEGVFTDSVVPKGDFSIIPPVYIGGSVQIESGSVIGPNTVIYNNTLVSENSSVRNSVLFENVYISSNCFVDGAILCDNASLKRNSAVFSGSVIGVDALVGEDMTVENGSLVNKNVRYDKLSAINHKKTNIFSLINKFQGLTPEKALLLGSAVATVFKHPKIIVGSDGSSNSLSLKLAFLSGLIASGNQCIDVGVTFKAQMHFSSIFCECEYSVFFSGKGGTDVEIFNSENEPISTTECNNLLDFCNKSRFNFNEIRECGNVRQITGLRKMYVREIVAFSDSNLPCVSEFICNNKMIVIVFQEILRICSKSEKTDNRFNVYMNENGTNVNINFKGSVYTQKELKKLVFFFLKNNSNFRIFESDLYERLWKYDSIILVITVLNIIKISGKELDELIKNLPEFHIVSRHLDLEQNNSKVAEKISSEFNFQHRNNNFNIKCKDGFVRIRNNREEGKIKIISSSRNMALSEELCDYFTDLLTKP